MRLLAAILIFSGSASAQVELQLDYAMLQKLVQQAAFTGDGRRFVRGLTDKSCTFAYLENPRIAPAGDKLQIRARFSGRSAMSVLGYCVGLGDSFELAIAATPYTSGTILRLKDVQITTDGRRGVYARSVAKALEQSLPGVFQYDLAPEAKRILEADNPQFPFRKELSGFTVNDVRVTAKALLLVIGFRLAVR